MRFLAAVFFTIALMADEPPRVQFNRQIRPLLSDRCFACHGPDQGNRKSPLRLDREADAKADLGKGRHGIVPGDPAKSGIYERISSANKAQRMPPAYAGHDRLPDGQIALIKRWIEEGANYEAHYSFIPPQRPPVPAGNAIDYFIRTRLDREGLKPMPETDRRTLLLSHLEASLEIGGRVFALGTNIWSARKIEPMGYRWLRSFTIDPTPTWTWAGEDWRLSRQLAFPNWHWM